MSSTDSGGILREGFVDYLMEFSIRKLYIFRALIPSKLDVDMCLCDGKTQIRKHGLRFFYSIMTSKTNSEEKFSLYNTRVSYQFLFGTGIRKYLLKIF